MVGILIQEQNSGADTQFLHPASPAPKHGQRTPTPGRREEDRHGARAPTIPNSISSIGERETQSRTIRDLAKVWTAYSRIAYWLFDRRQVKSFAIFNTRLTTSTMWTPPTSRCWRIFRLAASFGR